MPDCFALWMSVDGLLEANYGVVELCGDAVGLVEVLGPPSLWQPQPLTGLIGAVLVALLQRSLQ
eukprot:13484491-Heterocapsa_arctica.AAC.1